MKLKDAEILIEESKHNLNNGDPEKDSLVFFDEDDKVLNAESIRKLCKYGIDQNNPSGDK